MILRRSYVRGRRYAYYYKPEIMTWHELCAYADEHPDEGVFELDNATYFFDKLSKEEQHRYWRETVVEILTNTGAVLENLENMVEYKVGWNKYLKGNPSYGKPSIRVPLAESWLKSKDL